MPAPAKWPRLLLVACLYGLAHTYGYLMRVPPENVAAVWPASGLALGILLCTERSDRVATAVALSVGNLVSSSIAGNTFGIGVGFLLCNAIEAGLGLAMFGMRRQSRPSMGSVSDVATLIAVSTLGNAVSALAGAGMVRFAFGLPWREAYAGWWTSDGLGVLLVTPIVLSLSNVSARTARTLRGWQESLLFLAVWSAAAWAVFHVGEVFIALPYAMLALLAWAGLRLSPSVVAAALGILAAAASTSPLVGFGPSPLGGDDGRARMLLMQAYLWVTGAMGLLLVASRKETADALTAAREEQARVTSLADHLPGGVVFQLDWHAGMPRFVYVSARIRELIGVTPDALTRDASRFFGLVAPDDRPRLAVLEQPPNSGAQALKTDVEVRRGQTDVRQIAVSCSPRALEDGQTIWDGILVDVTERVNAEAALRASEARLQEAERLQIVGRLAGGVAHDFNNLLTIVGGYADMMLHGLPVAEWRESAEQVAQAARRGASLTQQLLAIGRRLIMAPECFLLRDVIDRTDRLLRRTVGEAVEVRHALSAQPQYVHADAAQIERVLLNLALNARDAMPDGGTLTIATGEADLSESKADERHVTAGRYVYFSLSDTGTGIHPDVRPHLFKPFFTTRSSGRGTGLGLATVEGVVQQSNGFITVDSEPGDGATFTVFLPAGTAASAVAPEILPEHLRGSERILFVEDDDAVRRLTETLLRHQGYDVVSASNGPDALREAIDASFGFDLVVTDVMMPGMAGPELIERLRQQSPGLRALFVSGYSDDAVLRTGVATGQAEFLQKPFTPAALVARVRSLLDT